MKRAVLVCYDICDSKRLQQVYKTLRAFGEHLQYSVFFCELSPDSQQELKGALQRIIDPTLDQILFIPTKPRMFFEHLGVEPTAPHEDCILVMESEADSEDTSETED